MPHSHLSLTDTADDDDEEEDEDKEFDPDRMDESQEVEAGADSDDEEDDEDFEVDDESAEDVSTLTEIRGRVFTDTLPLPCALRQDDSIEADEVDPSNIESYGIGNRPRRTRKEIDYSSEEALKKAGLDAPSSEQ